MSGFSKKYQHLGHVHTRWLATPIDSLEWTQFLPNYSKEYIEGTIVVPTHVLSSLLITVKENCSPSQHGILSEITVL